MKVKMFTVYDSKLNDFLRPFFMEKTEAALRSFVDVANDSTSEIGKHPSDFTLFEIGTFDTDSASIEVYEAKKSIACAIELTKENIK